MRNNLMVLGVALFVIQGCKQRKTDSADTKSNPIGDYGDQGVTNEALLLIKEANDVSAKLTAALGVLNKPTKSDGTSVIADYEKSLKAMKSELYYFQIAVYFLKHPDVLNLKTAVAALGDKGTMVLAQLKAYGSDNRAATAENTKAMSAELVKINALKPAYDARLPGAKPAANVEVQPTQRRQTAFSCPYANMRVVLGENEGGSGDDQGFVSKGGVTIAYQYGSDGSEYDFSGSGEYSHVGFDTTTGTLRFNNGSSTECE